MLFFQLVLLFSALFLSGWLLLRRKIPLIYLIFILFPHQQVSYPQKSPYHDKNHMFKFTDKSFLLAVFPIFFFHRNRLLSNIFRYFFFSFFFDSAVFTSSLYLNFSFRTHTHNVKTHNRNFSVEKGRLRDKISTRVRKEGTTERERNSKNSETKREVEMIKPNISIYCLSRRWTSCLREKKEVDLENERVSICLRVRCCCCYLSCLVQIHTKLSSCSPSSRSCV